MRKYILGAVLSLGIIISPAFTHAAGLTDAQAATIISVVQSSPGTPASAFINLITAFSGVTNAQAASLITVVQASPSTSATVFVPLLTSFTVGTSASQSTTQTTNTVTSTQPTSTTQSTISSSRLTNTQISSVNTILISFGANSTTISNVNTFLNGGAAPTTNVVSGLTSSQVQSILTLLSSFGADSTTISSVNTIIATGVTTTTIPVITVNPSSASIAYGGNVTFSWSVTPTAGTTCAAAGNGIGGMTGSSASYLNGTWTTPALYTSTTYGMVCSNSAGTTYKYVNVTVAPQTNTVAATTPTATINPNAIAYGNAPIPVSGNATNVSTLYVAAGLDSSGYTQSSLIAYPTNGSWSSSFSSLPAGTYTLKAYANNANGTLLATRALTVTASATTASTPAVPRIDSISPAIITAGQSTTIAVSGVNFPSNSVIYYTYAGSNYSFTPTGNSPTQLTSSSGTLPAGDYTFYVQGSGGQPSNTFPKTVVAPATTVAPTPTATINGNTLAYDNIPIPISGTASNVSAVYLTLTFQSGASQGVGPLSVAGGTWSAVFPAITAGTHTLTVRANSASGDTLATRSLTVAVNPTSCVWQGGNIPFGAGCIAFVPMGTLSNGQSSGTYQNQVSGYTGTVSFTCNNGTFASVNPVCSNNQTASALNALESATQSSGPAQTTAGFSYMFTQDLYRGMQGSEVVALQRALHAEGLFAGEATGNFYDVTREAVMAFQIRYGISPTGYVGATTREKLSALY